MRCLGILLLISCLTACATSGPTREGYISVCESWVGQDVNKILDSWGAPANVFAKPNGDKIYTYEYDGGVMAMPIYGMAFANRLSCTTRFIVNPSNTITGYNFEGNQCKSEPVQKKS